MVEAEIFARLEKAVGDIEEVMQICHAPSVSFGVVHKGEVVLRKSLGLRDVECNLEANPDSIYMLGSCSKMFTAAAVGHLVAQGKMDWLDPIHKHLPEFDPIGDPEVGQKADLIDAMRHSTGLADPIGLYLGPGNTVLDDDERFVELLNQMPTSNDEGQRFNSYWLYSNGAYGLVSKVVERVARTRFSTYVKENVFKPLGMTRSVVSRPDLDGNIAHPHIQLDNQTFTKLPSQLLGCEENSPMLAVMGMGTSLNDMLTWATAILSAERHEQQQSNEDEISSDEDGSRASVSNGSSFSSPERTIPSPLKHVSKVRKAYYTRPTKDQFQNEAAYCMGWFRLTMPSSLLGELSFNTMTKPESQPHMLGQASPQRLAIGHNGGVMGSLSAIWTFSETDSAVVALANGRSIGDAADFTAQILIQALFDLQPQVDIVSWARKERDLTHSWFEDKYLRPWRSKALSNDTPRRDSTVYGGQYQGFNGTYTFSIVPQPPKKQSETGSQLAVAFNRSDLDTMRPLYFADTDAYTFFPGSWNRWLVNSMPSLAYESSILKFKWDEAQARVEGLWWVCVDEKPSWFSRVEEK